MDQGIDFSQIPLRDIQLPGPVAWWPPAPGWWVLVTIVFAIGVYFLVRYLRAYRHRAALRALLRVDEMLMAGAAPAECLPTVSSVMRRFAMAVAANPRLVAGLVGERWLGYLDSRWDQTSFGEGAGRSLVNAPYAPLNKCSLEEARALTSVCVEWVKSQRAAH